MRSPHTTAREETLLTELEKTALAVTKTQHSPKNKIIFLNVLGLFFIFTFLHTYKIEKVKTVLQRKVPSFPLQPLKPQSHSHLWEGIVTTFKHI